MLLKFVRPLIVVAILVFANNCHAVSDWIEVARSADIFDNLTYQIKMASIETINSSTVRALTRLVKTNPNKGHFGDFPDGVIAVELIMDFDCKKQRYKTIQETRINTSGKRVQINDKGVPLYEVSPDGSLYSDAIRAACKAEGLMK